MKSTFENIDINELMQARKRAKEERVFSRTKEEMDRLQTRMQVDANHLNGSHGSDTPKPSDVLMPKNGS